MADAKKIGRPPLPKGQVKGKIVPVRLDDSDVETFIRAATRSGHPTLSSWIRTALKAAAQK